MHSEAYAVLKVLRDQLPWTPRAIYEVGSRIVEGQSQIRALFLGTPKYWGIDLLDGPGVDDLADAVTYEPPFTPDVIICAEMLEHLVFEQHAPLMAQLFRVLNPKGALFLTCAGPHRKPHGISGAGLQPGEYYRGLTRDYVEDLLTKAGFRAPLVWTPKGRLHSCIVWTTPEDRPIPYDAVECQPPPMSLWPPSWKIRGMDVYAMARKEPECAP